MIIIILMSNTRWCSINVCKVHQELGSQTPQSEQGKDRGEHVEQPLYTGTGERGNVGGSWERGEAAWALPPAPVQGR